MSLPIIVGGLMLGTACTDDFETINTSGIEVDPEDLPFEAQFAEPMNYCYPPQQNMFQFWTNLTMDMYCGYFMTPNGGFSNGDMGENRGHSGGMYENYYLHIFNNTRRIIEQCEANNQMGLAGVMRVVQAYGTLMTTDAYGPIAYSSVFGTSQSTSEFAYDSQKDIFKYMLDDLKQAVEEIKGMTETEKDVLASADTWCGGDTEKWVKIANQFRLRMALRLTKRGQEAKDMGVDIKQIAQEAIDGGILTKEDGDIVIAKGLENEMWLMFNWGDCGFGADLVTMMVGMKDPRLPLYMTKNRIIFKPGYEAIKDDAGKETGFYKNTNDENDTKEYTKEEATLIPEDTDYYGIAFASGLPAKPNLWGNLSNWIQGNSGSSYAMPLPIMKCAEGYFLRAEAKLRWDIGSERVQDLYEEGIRTSMEAELKYRGSYAGVTGYETGAVDNYINNDTDVQIDYVDPIASLHPELLVEGNTDPDINNRVAENDLPVKWDEGATDEEKLQRIITQKYFALFPLSIEAWAEQRRTGYPILFKGRVNESERTNDAAGLGPGGMAVNTTEGVRRVIYSSTCYDTNGAAMNDAIRILNEENTSSTISGDHGGTRVWWDNANVGNFENDGD